MKKNKISVFALMALFTAVVFSACQKNNSIEPATEQTGSTVNSGERNGPVVPPILEVPAGNRVSYHVFASGVQIYTCTETSPGVFAWVFTAPEAALYANAGFNGNGVGTHYAGPTWESNSGSKVAGTRLQGVTVDATAIPWLLLGAVSSQGPGIYEGTTYIQRVNTTGGLAPATGANASTVGQQARVPYTAEYYFYCAD
ncbi:MAG: DUF3455 domain-containing protein [Bacteroidia bacterium]